MHEIEAAQRGEPRESVVPRLVLFGVVYIAAAALGQWLVLVPGNAATMWPPSGLYLAALLTSDRRSWWQLIAVGYVADMLAGVSIYGFSVPVAVCIALGNSLEALCGAHLMRRWCGTPFQFSGVRDVLGLAFLGGAFSPMISATIGAATMAWSGHHELDSVWLLWWIGDAIGVLIIAPFVLVTLTRTGWQKVIVARWPECIALVAAFGAVTYLVLTRRFPFVFIALPLLLWATMRFGQVGAALALPALTFLVVRNTATDHGIFANPSFTREGSALMLQMFAGIASISSMLIAALIEEQQLHLRELTRAFAELEMRVKERTAVEQRLRLAQQIAHIGTFDYDVLSGVNVWTPELENIYGLDVGTFDGTQAAWQKLIHPDDRQLAVDRVREAYESGQPTEAEWRVVWPDGSVRWLAGHFQSFRDTAGKLVRLMGVNIDITERKRAEERLNSALDQLKGLATHLVTVREEERTRIARELHDELGQSLTGLKLELAWIKGRLARTNGDEYLNLLSAKVEEMSQIIDTTIQSMRRIVTELRPGVLDEFGLAAALEWQGQEFHKRTGIRCTVTVIDTGIDRDCSSALFRIVQEALTNVTRHADASEVGIQLYADGTNLNLIVNDNGKGMGDQTLSSSQSFGLLGMRERAAAAGGTFQITSRRGQGTEIVVRIPLASCSEIQTRTTTERF